MLRLRAERDELLPKYQTTGSNLFDIYCNEKDVVLYHNVPKVISTGLFIDVCSPEEILTTNNIGDNKLLAIPELCIRPRSGLFAKHGLLIVGEVDSDYRGEIKVMACLLGQGSLLLQKGERIAQGKLVYTFQVDGLAVINQTRNSNGFGSTGV